MKSPKKKVRIYLDCGGHDLESGDRYGTTTGYWRYSRVTRESSTLDIDPLVTCLQLKPHNLLARLTPGHLSLTKYNDTLRTFFNFLSIIVVLHNSTGSPVMYKPDP